MSVDTYGGMHPVSKLLDYEEFMDALRRAIRPKRTVEKVGLMEAVGRVCASDVLALSDMPPFWRATFDGYAVRAEDTRGANREVPAKLRVIGTSKPGVPVKVRVHRGEAVRVFTGGEIPEGADAVVLVENTELVGQIVKVHTEVKPSANLNAAGSDIRKGEVLIRAGTIVRPTDISLAASQGFKEIGVYQKPSVLIIPTGNEVKPVGSKLRYGEIYDSNSHGVAALLKEAGGAVEISKPLKDDVDLIEATVRKVTAYDLVVFIGGSSAGAEDYVSMAVSKLGKVLAHGVRLSPGRPTLFGKVGETFVVGLPGHPASSLAVTIMVLNPLMMWLTGRPKTYRTVEAVLDSDITGVEEGFTYFRTVRLEDGIAKLVYRSSSMYSSFLGADGYIVFRDVAPKKGEKVIVNLL
ncbi:MAG: molybdopterin molybdotransferase MoeA [Thermoprotei archaeon]